MASVWQGGKVASPWVLGIDMTDLPKVFRPGTSGAGGPTGHRRRWRAYRAPQAALVATKWNARLDLADAVTPSVGGCTS